MGTRWLVLWLCLVACGDNHTALRKDAGPGRPADAAGRDAAAPGDAIGAADGGAPDATPVIDGGAAPDATPVIDGGAAPDATPVIDGGATPDAIVVIDGGAAPDAIVVTDGGVVPDAGAVTDAATAVTVACYAEGSPGATCTSPDHCCFTNFNAQHDGFCSTSTCTWGTISCDGPEDCATGQRCCAHAIYDPDLGTVGYKVACQASPCGAPPLDQELCHTSATCTGGGTCVGAYGHDNDLPRALSICE